MSKRFGKFSLATALGALLAAPFLYVLSLGPVALLASRFPATFGDEGLAAKTVKLYLYPAEQFILEKPDLGYRLQDYIRLWAPPPAQLDPYEE